MVYPIAAWPGKKQVLTTIWIINSKVNVCLFCPRHQPWKIVFNTASMGFFFVIGTLVLMIKKELGGLGSRLCFPNIYSLYFDYLKMRLLEEYINDYRGALSALMKTPLVAFSCREIWIVSLLI